MFEKESNIEQDFTTINLDNYQTQKQKDKGYRLTCNPIVGFILIAFLFILLGVFELVSSFSALRQSITLTPHNNTLLTHPIPAYLNFPNSQTIALYLQVQNLTQFNHLQQLRIYQLEEIVHLEGQCTSYRLNKQIGKTVAVDGTPLNPEAIAQPCGYFPGIFPLAGLSASLTNGTSIPINTADLTSLQFQEQNINLSTQWVDLTNPLFQSWIEPNVVISTFKLIGRINMPLQGSISLSITIPQGLPSQLTQVDLVLEDTKTFGHSNISFVIINFVQSGVLFLFAFAFYYYSKHITQQVQQTKKQKPGDSLLLKKQNINKSDKQPSKNIIELRSISERDEIVAKSQS